MNVMTVVAERERQAQSSPTPHQADADWKKISSERKQAAAAAVLSDKQCLWKKEVGAPCKAPKQVLGDG